MNERRRRIVAYVVMLLAVIVAGFLGVRYPIPAPPDFEVGVLGGVMDIIVPTTQATGTPGVVIDNKSAGSVSLRIEAASTPVARVLRSGSIDAMNHAVVNIGAAGTDFGSSGELTLASSLAVGGDITLENSETIVNSTNDAITITTGITSSVLAIATGNLQVGDGAPDLTLNGGDAFVAGTLEADGAADLGSTLALASTLTQADGDVVIADDIRVISQTIQTVTNGDAFTATGTYQEITAAGEVTPTIGVGTVGDLLVLINVGSQTINVADTGTQMLSAAWAAGQHDVLILWSDGTNWIEISRSDN